MQGDKEMLSTLGLTMHNLHMAYLCSSGIVTFPMHISVVHIFHSPELSASLITFLHLPNPAEQPFSIFLTPNSNAEQ